MDTFDSTFDSIVEKLPERTRAAFVTTVHRKMQNVLAQDPPAPIEDPLHAYLCGFRTSASLFDDGETGAMLGAIVEVAMKSYYFHGTRPDFTMDSEHCANLIALTMANVITVGMANHLGAFDSEDTGQ